MAINFPNNPSIGQTYTQLAGLHIENTTVRSEVDYVKFTVGSTPITALYLTAYQSVDNIAFFAIQQGSAWTAGQNVNQMLLYSHFGPNTPGYTVGSNILSPQNITLQANTTYTMWIQQTGTNLTTYTFSTNSSYTGSPSNATDYSSNPASPTSLQFVNVSSTWAWDGVTWSLQPNNSPTFSSITTGTAAVSGSLTAGSVSTPGINTNTVNASGAVTALRFIGDGSQLTNLPLGTGSPGRVAYYNAQGVTSGTSTALTWNESSGTLTVQNLTVTGSLNASITITSLGFAQGVVVDEFSNDVTLVGNSDSAVPTEKAVKTYIDTEIGALDLSASGTVNTGTATQLAYYQTSSNAVNPVGSGLTWDATKDQLRASNLEVTSQLSTIADASIGDSLAVYNNVTIGADLVVAGRLKVKNIFDDTTGIVKFVSGSDFIIDAPGEVNVSGSRIANVATPIDTTDAVNKAYVDAASSQFAGGTVPNAIKILSNTASTSTTTGSLQTAGGLGVGGDGYFGGTIYVAGSPVLTSASGSYNGGTITGALIINNNTASTSTTTGALRVVGGMGVQGNLNVGGSFRSGGVAFGAGAQNYDTNVGIGGGAGVNIPLGSNVGGQNNIAIGYSTQGQLTSSNDNVSVGYNSMGAKTGGGSNVGIGSNTLSQNAGATNVAIGHNAQAIGATGDHNTSVGYNTLNLVTGINNTTIGSGSGSAITTGNYNLILGMYDGTSIATLNNNIIIADGQGNIRAQWDDTGKLTHAGAVTITDATASSSTSTGSLVVSGGLGVSGSVYATDFYGSGANLTGVIAQSFAGGNVAGITNFTSNTPSSSTTNGGVVVSGGLGVGGAVNVGNILSVAGTVTFTQNSASTSTTTGTLRVTGGMGVTGNVYANAYYGSGANLTGITASTASTASTVTLTANNAGNATYYPLFATAATGNVSPNTDTGFTYNASTGVLTATTFSGALSGNATSATNAGTVTLTANNAGNATYYPLFATAATGNASPNTDTGFTYNASTGVLTAATFSGNATSATSATQFNGITQTAYTPSIKAGFNISGGGTMTVSALGYVSWSNRFIVISNGFGTFSTNGYFDINVPTSGTITGVGGAVNKVATANGVPLAAWEALYYIIPVGGAATSATANFRVASYTSTLDVPHNWVLLCLRNEDTATYFFPHGVKLKAGESYGAETSAFTSSVPTTSGSAGDPGTIARDANYIYFCVAVNTWERVAIDTTVW